MINLLYKGWSTYNLRLLPQGINMHAILLDSATMNCFVKELRDRIQSQKIDILALGRFLYKTNNTNPASKATQHPSITESAGALADDILTFLQQRVRDSNTT